MNNIETILLNEYHKYPLMEIDDYIKVIFQHINGGNHLLKNPEMAKRYLLEEYDSIKEDSTIPLEEDIGNSIVRINLARYKYEGLDINLLFDIFVKSASIYQKDIEAMEEAFNVLIDLVNSNLLPLNIKDLKTFLSIYRENDYPLISHSKTYKREYNPHYRIIHKEYLNQIIK